MIHVTITSKDQRLNHAKSFDAGCWKEIGEYISAWLILYTTKCEVQIEY